MNKYTVLDKTFSRFEDVVQWAWDWYKIDIEVNGDTSEAQKQTACKELTELLMFEGEGGNA